MNHGIILIYKQWCYDCDTCLHRNMCRHIKKQQQIVIKPGEKPQGIIKSLQSERTNKKTGMMKNNLYEQRRSRNEWKVNEINRSKQRLWDPLGETVVGRAMCVIPEAKRRGSCVTEGHGRAVCFLAQGASLTLIDIGGFHFRKGPIMNINARNKLSRRKMMYLLIQHTLPSP